MIHYQESRWQGEVDGQVMSNLGGGRARKTRHCLKVSSNASVKETEQNGTERR